MIGRILLSSAQPALVTAQLGGQNLTLAQAGPLRGGIGADFDSIITIDCAGLTPMVAPARRANAKTLSTTTRYWPGSCSRAQSVALESALPTLHNTNGNLATEDVAFMLASMGVVTGVDIDKLLALRQQLVSWLPDTPTHGTLWPAGLPKSFTPTRANTATAAAV